MKIALILTGFARKNYRAFSSIKKNILDKYDTDIYLSTWDKIETKYNPHISKKTPDNRQLNNVNKEIIKNYYNQYSLKKAVFHNYDDFYQNRFEKIKFLDRENDVFKQDEQAKNLGSFWVERLRDQWYIVKNGWNMIDDKSQYDIFIRLRFDVYLYSFVIKDSNLVLPPPEFDDFEIADYMAYGNYTSMKNYCNIFDHIKSLYEDYNTNIAVSEKMLYFYLDEYCKINFLIDKGIVYTRLAR